ncbi:MAG: hypothetical protein Kow00122_20580 [Thermoleophilia bacterium]
MLRAAPADTLVVISDSLTWVCPECGGLVRLSDLSPGPGDTLDEERLDRLAHALCGCYVLHMPTGSLSRLLASVLAVEPSEERGGSDQP